jgi:membrane-anchored mycosin MYCP
MSAKQVINRIVSTAKDEGAPGKDPLYGFGVLNAEAALKDDVAETKANPLGSIADWIRVHRRGNLATPAPEPTAPAATAQATLPKATVPVAVPPSQLDSALPAAVVIGFGGLFIAIIVAGAVQLRRAYRASGGAVEEPETGAVTKVEPADR